MPRKRGLIAWHLGVADAALCPVCVDGNLHLLRIPSRKSDPLTLAETPHSFPVFLEWNADSPNGDSLVLTPQASGSFEPWRGSWPLFLWWMMVYPLAHDALLQRPYCTMRLRHRSIETAWTDLDISPFS